MLSRIPNLCALACVCLAASGPAPARDLAVPESELVVVELATVAIVPGTSAPVVLLREPESGQVVPIFIGHAEAQAILFALKGVTPPRPMSHDLMLDVIRKMSGTIERVIVDDLRDGTYHGAVEVRIAPGRSVVRIDARPSDALALAVRSGAEIRLAPAVLRSGQGLKFEGIDREQVVTALGITVVEATGELREALALPADRGVLASSATGLAAFAGIQPGVLILKVNGVVPETPMAFLDLVRKTPAGEMAVIEFWHDGQRQVIRVPTTLDRGRSAGQSL